MCAAARDELGIRRRIFRPDRPQQRRQTVQLRLLFQLARVGSNREMIARLASRACYAHSYFERHGAFFVGEQRINLQLDDLRRKREQLRQAGQYHGHGLAEFVVAPKHGEGQSGVERHNANRAVPDFLESGNWQPRASIPTLASAMDVGSPSNMERLRSLFPDIGAVRGAVRAVSVSDAEIHSRIAADYRQYGKIWCPHTATAAEAYARLDAQERAAGRWIMVSTAHPAKFREIVEPLIGQRIEMPESLAKLFSRPASATELQPTLAALTGALENKQ